MNRRWKVAYLGPPSSHTFQAALKVWPNESSPKVELQGAESIRQVFEHVQAESTQLGIVPWENSSYGPVIDTLDCLVDANKEFPDIAVCHEVNLTIEHCLITSQTCSTGETKSGFYNITDIYSHPQALGQCQRFIANNIPKAVCHEVASTAAAAHLVARSGNSHGHVPAAITSALAAKEYGLQVVRQGIQDAANNQTNFIVLRKSSDTSNSDDVLRISSDLKLVTSRSMIRVTHPLNNKCRIWQLIPHLDNIPNFIVHRVYSRPSRQRAWHETYLIVMEESFESSPIGELQARSMKDTMKENIVMAIKDKDFALLLSPNDMSYLGNWAFQ